MGIAAALSLALAPGLLGAPSPGASNGDSIDPTATPPGLEIPGLRTRTSNTYVGPGGGYHAVIAAGSVNYRDSAGKWQPIDNTLLPDPLTGVVRNKANAYGLSLPSLASQGVRVDAGDAFVELALEGAGDSKPVISGSSASYPDVLPGVDLAYTAGADQVKEDILIKRPTAQTSFVFRVRTSSGLRPSVRRGGEVALEKAGGAAQFLLSAPVMTDAAGASSDSIALSPMTTARGTTITVTPDPSWLADPARKYPVVVDPNIAPNPVTDCSIISGSSANTSYCSDTAIKVGWDGTKAYRSLLRFDLSSIPARSTVNSAQLALYRSGGTTSTPIPINLHRLTRPSTGSATWNKYDGTNSWTSSGGDFQAAPDYSKSAVYPTGTWTSFWPTSLVQGWVDGAIANNGVILKEPSETTNDVISFYSSDSASASKRPYLNVYYWPWLGQRSSWTYDSSQLTDRTTSAVNIANGNLTVHQDDLLVAGTGLPLNVGRTFNNLSTFYAPPAGPAVQGNKWVLSTGHDVQLRFFGGDSIAFQAPSGYDVPFTWDDSAGKYIAPAALDADLVQNGGGTYTLTFHGTGQIYQFSSAGVLTAEQDRNGNQNTFAYNGSGSLTHITDSQGRATTFAYNGSGFVSSITGPGSRTFSYSYNADDDMSAVTDPEGKVTTFAYSGYQITTITSPEGFQTVFAYDSAHRVTSVKRITNGAAGTGPTTTYNYGASMSGCPSGTLGATERTDPNSQTTRYCYDELGRVTKTYDPNGHARTATYTPNDDPDTVTSPLGATTDTAYNARNNPTSVSLPDGTAYNFTYADASHPDQATTATQPSGATTSYVFTSGGNVCSVSSGASPPASCTTSASNQTRMTYNANGTIATSTDPNGNVTNYGYNAAGNLTTIDHPAPLGDESYTYDASSRVATHTDGKGQTTSFAYDKMDRVTLVTYAGGATVTYAYDGNGNRVSRADGTGTTTYAFDRLNRLTTESLPGGTSNGYTYDAGGNLASFTDAGGTVGYGYDAAGNVSSVSEPGGVQTTLAYDADDRLTTTTLPSSTGVVITRTWGSEGLLSRIRATKGATVLTDFRSCYRTPVSGCSTTPQTGTVTGQRWRSEDLVTGDVTDYSYDALGRLTRAQTTGTNPSDFQYAYDAAGNRTTETVNGGSPTSYSYNGAGQMTAVGGVTYSYDGNGNLTGNSAGLSLSYNAKDQTTSITPAGGAAVAMAYAGEGQSERTQAGGTTYTHNALGLGYETTSGSATYYTRLPDGTLLGERKAAGNYYYLVDQRDAVVRLVDSTGAAVNGYSYEPFGKVATASGSVQNPFKFASGYQDASGLYKEGARYRDAGTGTWTQPDPNQAGLATPLGPGYEYGLSDPVNNTDPSGQYSLTGCYYPLTARQYVPQADLRPLLRPLCVPRRVYLISSIYDTQNAFVTGFLWCYAVSLHGYGPKYSLGALWTGVSAWSWCAAGSRSWGYVRYWR